MTLILATERGTNAEVRVDIARPRCIGIFGKRGSGKTETLKRIAAAAARAGHLVIIIDPLSAIRPRDHVRVYLGEPETGGHRLELDPSALSPDAWLSLFQLKPSDPMGIALFRAVLELQKSGAWWGVAELAETVMQDDRAAEKTRQALENRLTLAMTWKIFAESENEPLSAFRSERINVLDLGKWDPGPNSLRNLATRLLAERLFAARMEAWRGIRDMPPVLLAVDEAHNFAPANVAALARPVLVRWAKEGRQPHATLLIATQQPSAVSFELVSQSDLVIIHRLTLSDDIKTTGRLASTYAKALPALMKALRLPGEAIIIDDLAETVAMGRVILEE